jgi:hypothetical protein
VLVVANVLIFFLVYSLFFSDLSAICSGRKILNLIQGRLLECPTPGRNELCSALQVLRGPFVGSVAARGRRLAAVAVGELCSARSPGIVGRKKHGFRGGFGGRG